MRTSRLLRFALAALLVAACATSTPAREPDATFSCTCPGGPWSARLRFDETGRATLGFAPAHGESGTRGSCALAIRDLALLPQAEVPMMQATLTHESCSLPSALSGEILGRLYLKVTKTDTSAGTPGYRARLQWLRHSQPVECKVTRLDSQAMKRLETRWKDGNL